MIYPTKEQADKIIRFCHGARYAYNWAISVEEENYKNGGKFISGYNLLKMFTQFKNQKENQWLKELSGRALKNAILDATKAYENFFLGRAKHPKFKSKKRSKLSCSTHEARTKIEPKRIQCEKLGWIKSHKHNIPIGSNVKYYQPKLLFDGDNFWFSVAVEIMYPEGENELQGNVPLVTVHTEPVGIDLGLKTLATCSNGMCLTKPNIDKDKKASQTIAETSGEALCVHAKPKHSNENQV